MKIPMLEMNLQDIKESRSLSYRLSEMLKPFSPFSQWFKLQIFIADYYEIYIFFKEKITKIKAFLLKFEIEISFLFLLLLPQINLVRVLRVFLELFEISKDTIEDKTSNDKRVASKALRKTKEYKFI